MHTEERTQKPHFLKDKNGYHYSQAKNDPFGVRIYTLENGLQVFLAINEDAPRIQTYIPVKTGSNRDPQDNTGLAHYLEHMMFKGTSRLGTADWPKEQQLLSHLSDLFELHKAESDLQKKKEIYKDIDKISHEASKYAIANEYDKAISSLGATGTNAHTWLDETVYKNNIPKNELEKWLKIEKERFSDIAIRLFHTELESVYEEFNRAQDNDGRLVHYAVMESLFPNHPNGQQTTLGKAEHLKNPSMVALHQYFETYYVPNNMALVLVGDLDFEETIELIDRHFGTLPYRELPVKPLIEEEPLTTITERSVKSPSAPRLQLAWRTSSYGTREEKMAEIAAQVLCNSGEAGLLDLFVNQNQKALRSYAYQMGFKQYGVFSMLIIPKENQSLEQAEALLLEQMEKMKRGEFPDWLVPAIVNDMKLQRIKSLDTADGLATALYHSFTMEHPWERELHEMSEFENITKEEITAFARETFLDNYVRVKKEFGENETLIHVDNPGITPVNLNRDQQSEFLTEILSEKTQDIAPHFIDYSKAIHTEEIKDKKLSFVENRYNDIAQIHLIFPFGTDHDREWGLAFDVVQFWGTRRETPHELKEAFFKMGVSFDFSSGKDTLRISLSGLEENIHEGLQLLKHWLTELQPDAEIYEGTVKLILESREVVKKDQNRIKSALLHYAKYGPESRFRDVIPTQRLIEINPEDLASKIHQLLFHPYEIFYYGKDLAQFKSQALHFLEESTLPVPPVRLFPEPETNGKVYFTEYDMVQVEMHKVARGKETKIQDWGKAQVFNEYFGRGLSSIIFQELRERRSLAYSAYVNYATAEELHLHNYITAYIGTQPNKLQTAVDALQGLMKEMPKVESQFNNAKSSALKQLASSRINRTNIYFNYRRLQKLNIDYDMRKPFYEEIQKLTFEQLAAFYENEIKPASYNVALIGKRADLDMKAVQQLGTFHEVSLEELFGY